MLVRFQRDFFIEGHLYPAGRIVEVLDRFTGQLPGDAEIVDGERPKKETATVESLTPQQKAARTRAENKARKSSGKGADQSAPAPKSGQPRQKAGAS